MNAKLSPLVQKEIIKMRRKDRKLAEKIEKQILVFEKNPKHPSLRTHKLSGNLQESWSISITTSIRMVYVKLGKEEVVFIKIGTHNEVYGK